MMKDKIESKEAQQLHLKTEAYKAMVLGVDAYRNTARYFFLRLTKEQRLSRKANYEKNIGVEEAKEKLYIKDGTELPQMLSHWKKGLAFLIELMEELGELGSDVDSKKSCSHSCSPSDYCEGGKCDRMGCYVKK